jgi:hypothetical protein
MRGLAQIYSSWITRFKVDGFRVDTAKHVNAAFFKLWVPKVRGAAASIGVKDFPIFGEVTLNDAVDLSAYVRDRGLPQVLDFPLQQVAVAYASGASGSRGVAQRVNDDDYFRTPTGIDPSFTTFLGNHDMGRGAEQILQQAPGLSGNALLQRVLLGYDVLYLLRGAPSILYGDEIGMAGPGGDKAARQDMFPTQVSDWQTETRVGSPPIGKGSSFDVTTNPIEVELKRLAALRDADPGLSTGWSIVRYAKGPLLVVSRIDPVLKTETVVAFNNDAANGHGVMVSTSTPSSNWDVSGPVPVGAPCLLTDCVTNTHSNAAGKLVITLGPLSSIVARAQQPIPVKAPAKPKLTVRGDDLSGLWVASASVSGPVSVTFVVRRGSTWQRLDTDTSPPYRGFIDPSKFKRNERVQVAAIARSLDGSTAVSAVVPFRVRH